MKTSSSDNEHDEAGKMQRTRIETKQTKAEIYKARQSSPEEGVGKAAYLGHILSSQWITVDPEKVRAISCWNSTAYRCVEKLNWFIFQQETKIYLEYRLSTEIKLVTIVTHENRILNLTISLRTTDKLTRTSNILSVIHMYRFNPLRPSYVLFWRITITY